MNIEAITEACRVLDIDGPNQSMETPERVLERIALAVVDWNSDIEVRLQAIEELMGV